MPNQKKFQIISLNTYWNSVENPFSRPILWAPVLHHSHWVLCSWEGPSSEIGRGGVVVALKNCFGYFVAGLKPFCFGKTEKTNSFSFEKYTSWSQNFWSLLKGQYDIPRVWICLNHLISTYVAGESATNESLVISSCWNSWASDDTTAAGNHLVFILKKLKPHRNDFLDYRNELHAQLLQPNSNYIHQIL